MTVWLVLSKRESMLVLSYRGTSLIRKRPPLGPYSSPTPRVIWGSYEGGRFVMGTRHQTLDPKHQTPTPQHQTPHPKQDEEEMVVLTDYNKALAVLDDEMEVHGVPRLQENAPP